MVSDGLFDFKFRSICCYGICFTFKKSKRAAFAALRIQTTYSTQVTISSIGLRDFLVISLAR